MDGQQAGNGTRTEEAFVPNRDAQAGPTARIRKGDEHPEGQNASGETECEPLGIQEIEYAHPGHPDPGMDSALDSDRYKALHDRSNFLVYVHDLEGRFSDANHRTLSLLGYAMRDISSLTLSSLLPPEHWSSVLKAFQGLLQNGIQSEPIIYPLRKRQGGFLWIEGEFTLVSLNGQPCAIQAIGRDISDRRSAEEALRSSEEKYRVLVESAHEGILVVQDGIIKFANARAAELIGIPMDESPHLPFDSLLPTDDHGLAFELYRKGPQNPSIPHIYAFRIRDEAGNTRWIEISAIRFGWEGKPATLNFLSDITWRKRAEEALQTSEEKYRRVVENAHEAIFILQNGKVKYHNPNTEELLGIGPVELAATHFAEWIVPDDRDEVIELFEGRSQEEGAGSVHAFRVQPKGGGASWVEANMVHVSWDGGPALLCFVRDVNEQRELQFQLQQSQKMEAIGRLTGGIAHDFNNMMTVVIGYSEYLMKGFKENEQVLKGLEGIKKAGEHAAELTQQLLAFSRKQLLRPRVLDLNAIIENADQMLRRILKEDIELATALDPGLMPIKADSSQLLQVVMNLAVNARDAMPKGGRLTIETRNVDLDDAYARHHVDAQPGPHVMLAVSDTGVGMDEKTRIRIFEPFFTTKEKGHGTGLGLATVYGIVRQSGGNIWVYSEPGAGTTFKIYLPSVSGDADASPVWEKREVSAPPKGWETILLVEDEEGLRDLMREVLSGMQYEVLGASNPDEAISAFREHRGPIHLLLTDVVMPRMNGPDLAKHLRSLRPEMKVLYVSGYTDNTAILHGALESGKSFLEKPFSTDTLLRRIREILDESDKPDEPKVAACTSRAPDP